MQRLEGGLIGAETVQGCIGREEDAQAAQEEGE